MLSSRLPDLIFVVALLALIGRGNVHAAGEAATATASPPATTTVDFERDIRPILSNHCYQCHGVDEETREADLRLDVRAAAVEFGAIVPGKAAESPLIERIMTTDPDLQMPPASANKPLTERQRELLQRWVNAGAVYTEHWAFQPVVRPEIPATKDDSWCRNEIDAFVLDRLRQEGLEPSAEASPTTLVRRVHQDLTGLIPTPVEATRYFDDSAPDAYEHLVDQLLASPHYGERWGRHWLDQARYADSHGYTIDGPRVMWPYRDWVIWALNEDMPFDQFTIEQLAGDLLPDPSQRQLVATAFHRNTMINQEGGVKPDQYRHEAMIDRVNTTGAVWLGLTVGCAQCHTHKYDPILQEEYYRLYSCLNRTVDSNNTGPTVPVREGELFGWTDEQRSALAEYTRLQTEYKRLEKSKDESNLSIQDWQWQTPQPERFVTESNVPLKLLEDGSLLVGSGVTANEAYEIDLAASATDSQVPATITAIRLRVLTDPSLPKQGPGRAGNGNFVLTGLHVRLGEDSIPLAQAWSDHAQPGYPVAAAIDGNARTGWAINVDGQQSKAGHKMNAPHEAIFVLAKPVKLNGQPLSVTLRHDLNENYLIGRFAFDVSSASPAPRSESSTSERLAQMRQHLNELQTKFPGDGSSVDQLILREMAEPPLTHLLKRGDFLNPDTERGPLSPGIPQAFDTTGNTEIQNRLDLAQWLVSRHNPLTARVIVNRIWGQYFGKGLVETENDLGLQGSLPTHPELLNWLAAEFMEQGWSLKRLHRLIVTSATYRQASEVTPEMLERDPRNLLLGRQSRFRMEAEAVRDQALVASGLFTRDVGGPSVYPPQPEGIYAFTQNKKNWPTSTGPDRYRRTMYTMFYRSAPYPLLTTFDAPDFSTVCTRRARSNTPLQSLTMANDPALIELAQGLARHLLNNGEADTPARLRLLYLHCLSRQPSVRELQVLEEYLHREHARFEADPELTGKFLAGTTAQADSIELATWTSVARLMFNTDEFLTRN
ncbi:MAG: PSD1 domain-containing protein [Planctomycetaceae bacterium]|nr:PSD1 domain-containing protein [Planctomycetaceae bacterium]